MNVQTRHFQTLSGNFSASDFRLKLRYFTHFFIFNLQIFIKFRIRDFDQIFCSNFANEMFKSIASQSEENGNIDDGNELVERKIDTSYEIVVEIARERVVLHHDRRVVPFECFENTIAEIDKSRILRIAEKLVQRALVWHIFVFSLFFKFTKK